MSSDFNSAKRLFSLWKEYSGEDLAPAEKHGKPRKEAHG